MRTYLVFSVALLSSGLVSSGQDQRLNEFRRAFAQEFDIDKLHSGVITFSLTEVSGVRNRVTFVFAGEKYYKRTLVESNDGVVTKYQWFDGQYSIRGKEQPHPTFTINTADSPSRLNAFLFFESLYPFRKRTALSHEEMKPSEVQSSDEGLSFVYTTDKGKTSFLVPESALDSKAGLPRRITTYLADGKEFAVWNYDGWKLYEGEVWLPGRCDLIVHWENVADSGRNTETQQLKTEEAHFNMIINSCWFIPQFPPNSTVQDNTITNDLSMVTTNFNGRSVYTSGILRPFQKRH